MHKITDISIISAFALLSLAIAGCGGATSRDAGRFPAPLSEGWTTDLLGEEGGGWQVSVTAGGIYAMGFHVDLDATEVVEPSVTLRRLDPRDGRVLWDTRLSANTGVSAKLLSGEGAVVITVGARIEVLDSATGALRWARGDLGASIEEVALHRGRVVLGLGDGSVIVSDQRSGRGLWRVELAPWSIARFRPLGDRLFAVADLDDEGQQRIGVFEIVEGEASELLWERTSATAADETWDCGELLVGRIGGVRLAGVGLSDGHPEFEGVDRPPGARWVAGRFVTDEAVNGVVLRMRRLSAFEAGEPDEPTWTTSLVSSGELVALEEGGPGTILVGAAAEYSLFEASTGRLIWRAHAPSVDEQGRTCTVLGTDGRALYQDCRDFESRVLVARAAVAARSRDLPGFAPSTGGM